MTTASASRRALVTGGSGFLGTQLVQQLLDHNWDVRILDKNPSSLPVQSVLGDIRDPEACRRAATGVDAIFHNVALVPLTRAKREMESVNVLGTATIAEAATQLAIEDFVMTSSSAVFGLPSTVPANSIAEPEPCEIYGSTKLRSEHVLNRYMSRGLKVRIVRPRTILGPGRLGLFGYLFDWVSKGLAIPVLGTGDQPYQFIHSRDLCAGLVAAASAPIGTYHLGALEYGSLRDDLEALCAHAQTAARVVAVPAAAVRVGAATLSAMRVLPFAEYQLKLYSRAMYFDSEQDWSLLATTPVFSNAQAIASTYDWFLENTASQSASTSGSPHQSLDRGLQARVANFGARTLTLMTRAKRDAAPL